MTVKTLVTVAAIALAPAASMAQDWTGAYGGLSFGGSDIEATVKPLGDLKLPGDGNSTGLFAGYNYQVGGIVYGAEFDFDATNYNVSDLVLVESTARLKARIGVPIGSGLVYGVAGVVGASTNSVLPDDPSLTPVNGFAVEDGVGYLVGAGYDMKFGDNFLAGAEVLYHEFDDDALNVEVTTLRLRVGYTF